MTVTDFKKSDGHGFHEWDDLESLAAAREQMIATLDTFRDTLEDLGGGRGVTDPVSGPVVLAMK